MQVYGKDYCRHQSDFYLPKNERELNKWLIKSGFSPRVVYNIKLETKWIFYNEYLDRFCTDKQMTKESRLKFIKELENGHITRNESKSY
jgi:hypothetical protein